MWRPGKASVYDPRAIVQWAIEREIGSAAPDDGGAAINLERERARLTREQADHTALKNGQIRKQLAPIKRLEEELSNVCGQIAAVLESIPLRVKRRVPRLTASEVEAIKREIVRAQNVAAGVGPLTDDDADDTRSER